MAYHPNPTPYHPFMHASTYRIALQLFYPFFFFSLFVTLVLNSRSAFLVIVYAFFLLRILSMSAFLCAIGSNDSHDFFYLDEVLW